METHSSILACRIPRMEAPGRLHPMGCKESDTTEQLSLSFSLSLSLSRAHTHTHRVKCFSIVNEAEVDIFLEFLASSVIQQMLAI